MEGASEFGRVEYSERDEELNCGTGKNSRFSDQGPEMLDEGLDRDRFLKTHRVVGATFHTG